MCAMCVYVHDCVSVCMYDVTVYVDASISYQLSHGEQTLDKKFGFVHVGNL